MASALSHDHKRIPDHGKQSAQSCCPRRSTHCCYPRGHVRANTGATRSTTATREALRASAATGGSKSARKCHVVAFREFVFVFLTVVSMYSGVMLLAHMQATGSLPAISDRLPTVFTGLGKHVPPSWHLPSLLGPKFLKGPYSWRDEDYLESVRYHLERYQRNDADAMDPPNGHGFFRIWDHPEPNHVFSPGVAEFFSTVTAFPIASSFQLFLGIRLGYDMSLMRVSALTFIMYNLAFGAHLSLQKQLFESTVSAVMFAAITTFYLYSYRCCKSLLPTFGCTYCEIIAGSLIRFGISLGFMVLVWGNAGALPEIFGGPNSFGGPWALFYIQAPPVFIATAITIFLHCKQEIPELQDAIYQLMCAGLFLSAAMVVSYLECTWPFWQMDVIVKLVTAVDFMNVVPHRVLVDVLKLNTFPFLHIVIHVFEQIGIYKFLGSLSALHHFEQKHVHGSAKSKGPVTAPNVAHPGAAEDVQAQPSVKISFAAVPRSIDWLLDSEQKSCVPLFFEKAVILGAIMHTLGLQSCSGSKGSSTAVFGVNLILNTLLCTDAVVSCCLCLPYIWSVPYCVVLR
eukprot:TRINITY_DN22372_c1_g2_i1.p1 TRINITY_DN22372_c1_g2~~TRINITY_DN22372_c1_g2_i1.p1  ORF type:complete len:570 (-),score=40.34 TRINITY_DN22372_c1_g2_i1:41-1750(-)